MEELKQLTAIFQPKLRVGKRIKKLPKPPGPQRRKVTQYEANKIYELHYNAQKSFKEIAEFLRLPVATAFKCLRRYERNGKQVIDGRRFNG